MFRKFKKLKRVFYKFLSSLYDKPLAPPTDKEKQFVEKIKVAFREFQSLEPVGCSPSEKEWLENANRLRELVLGDDLREFLRWDVVLKTMAVTNAGYVSPELTYLKSRPDWNGRWATAIKESNIGHPIPYWQYPSSSGNLIHHAYHLAKFEEKTEMHANNMSLIFEFGGGYGSMCRLIHHLGFEGKYVLFDLPAFSALQTFFLESTGITVHSFEIFESAQSGVLCTSDLEELKEILSKHFEQSNSMFIATWSISETPISLRNSILPLITPFEAFLIAYQAQFGEVDNISFFKDWTSAQENIEWQDWQIKHIQNNNRYLIGKRIAN